MKNIVKDLTDKILAAKLTNQPKYVIQELQQQLDLQLEKNKI